MSTIAMKIPVAYILRSLTVRRTTALMTAIGVALTVSVFVATLSTASGLRAAFANSSHPLNVLVLRKGTSAELASIVSRETYRELVFQPGIATEDGHPMTSLELATVVTLTKAQGSGTFSATLRGLMQAGVRLRGIRLAAGRWVEPGHREIVLGASIARRCTAGRVGGRLRIGTSDWDVVGVLAAGNSAADSEILADVNDVAEDFNRRNQFTSVLVGAVDAGGVGGLIDSLNGNRRLNVNAQTEASYYNRQRTSGIPVLQLGIIVSLIMSVGSCFAAMNTMYAAMSHRAREVGTLRVLGFPRRSVLSSFLLESLILAGVGGLIGCLAALPLNFVSTAIGNFTTMSETAFRLRVGVSSIVAGIGFSLFIGVVGGFLPARMAARKNILTALRETTS